MLGPERACAGSGKRRERRGARAQLRDVVGIDRDAACDPGPGAEGGPVRDRAPVVSGGEEVKLEANIHEGRALGWVVVRVTAAHGRGWDGRAREEDGKEEDGARLRMAGGRRQSMQRGGTTPRGESSSQKTVSDFMWRAFAAAIESCRRDEITSRLFMGKGRRALAQASGLHLGTE